MKRFTFFAVLFFITVAAMQAAAAPEQPADLVLRHGAVYTVDAARSWAESIAVRGGRIVYVGDDAGIAPWIGGKTRTIELAGKMVLPGFTDAHVHPVESGVAMGYCILDGLETKEKIIETIRAYADSHKDSPWILGSGWPLPAFPNANPLKEWLDEAVPDRPALMTAADGHSTWANSRALAAAGITKATKDPESGRIERNEAGEPTGTLRETASDLAYAVSPKPTAAQQAEGLEKALREMNRLGITGFVEANAGEGYLQAYREVENRGRLTARVTVSMQTDPAEDLSRQIERLKNWRKQYQGKYYRATAAKIFEDGVVEAGTAAVLEPYLDSKQSGFLNWDPEKLKAFAELLDREKFQIHIHAIGDRGVRVSLDALEYARNKNGSRDGRPILAHIQLIHPNDVPRFAALNVIPCFQPIWAYADAYIRDLTLPKLTPETARENYPMHSVAVTGATMALGSDWNVSSVNPLDGMEVAVTRRDPEEATGDSFIPEERLDLPGVLAAYTIGSAYANFREKETGSVETGKSADLVVLDKNLFRIPPEQINEAKVLLTLFEGREVYTDPDWK